LRPRAPTEGGRDDRDNLFYRVRFMTTNRTAPEGPTAALPGVAEAPPLDVQTAGPLVGLAAAGIDPGLLLDLMLAESSNFAEAAKRKTDDEDDTDEDEEGEDDAAVPVEEEDEEDEDEEDEEEDDEDEEDDDEDEFDDPEDDDEFDDDDDDDEEDFDEEE
jgi:hypothetical protein